MARTHMHSDVAAFDTFRTSRAASFLRKGTAASQRLKFGLIWLKVFSLYLGAKGAQKVRTKEGQGVCSRREGMGKLEAAYIRSREAESDREV